MNLDKIKITKRYKNMDEFIQLQGQAIEAEIGLIDAFYPNWRPLMRPGVTFETAFAEYKVEALPAMAEPDEDTGNGKPETE